MIDDNDHPEMIRAHQDILRRLGSILGDGTHPLTKPFLESMVSCIEEHRSEWRAKGVDFPTLVPICIPRIGLIEFARADLDLESIKTKIVNIVRFNPKATMQEVVGAFQRAFPHIRPDDVTGNFNAGKEADFRQRERQARIEKEVNKQLGIEGGVDGKKLN